MKKMFFILFATSFVAFSCGNGEDATTNTTYEHFCSHCGEGFNGSGYVKDSGGYIFKISSSELESYPVYYCTNSCAIIG